MTVSQELHSPQIAQHELCTIIPSLRQVKSEYTNTPIPMMDPGVVIQSRGW
jgi:hypothetical protein